ncbi:hypothetical protein RRG08_036378 [Elysia crispata]|uniref:Uncharacterized protein n=1 Tax=Elysia crispata TaxID=231223 RepID=A0AAE1DHI0_9GAST|nr:hypothetical protein RRG08_036378 [Elysia crispata]
MQINKPSPQLDIEHNSPSTDKTAPRNSTSASTITRFSASTDAISSSLGTTIVDLNESLFGGFRCCQCCSGKLNLNVDTNFSAGLRW